VGLYADVSTSAGGDVTGPPLRWSSPRPRPTSATTPRPSTGPTINLGGNLVAAVRRSPARSADSAETVTTWVRRDVGLIELRAW